MSNIPKIRTVVSERLINNGFKKSDNENGYMLQVGESIFDTTYFVRLTLLPLMGNIWAIQLSKTVFNGSMMANINMGRVSMGMTPVKNGSLDGLIDSFVDYILEHEEIKMVLRKKKIEKLKQKC